MGLFSHKKRLVIVDADAMDLAEFKVKYRHFGYDVTAILVADAKQRAMFCGENHYGAIDAKRIEQHDLMYPHVPGIQRLDYIVTCSEELVALVAHLNPDLFLTDYDMHNVDPAFADGGVGIVRIVREIECCREIPIVLHASEFDLKGRDPEFVEIAPLNFWITRKHDADVYRCFERQLLEQSRAKAREKYEPNSQ